MKLKIRMRVALAKTLSKLIFQAKNIWMSWRLCSTLEGVESTEVNSLKRCLKGDLWWSLHSLRITHWIGVWTHSRLTEAAKNQLRRSRQPTVRSASKTRPSMRFDYIFKPFEMLSIQTKLFAAKQQLKSSLRIKDLLPTPSSRSKISEISAHMAQKPLAASNELESRFK